VLTNDDDELDRLKTEIDLRDYALSLGYEIDPQKSTRHETYMVCGADKINVHFGRSGDWLWYSFTDDGSGTIIDFVRFRQGIENLGHIRQILRPWIGRDRSPRLPPAPKAAAPKDTAAVRAKCISMPVATSHAYLEGERHIPAAVLTSDRFAGRVRTNEHGDAVFPHWNRTGICGFEIRGRKFKGFSSGGSKGLWCSHVRTDDSTLVLCESGINCLSYSVLFPNPLTRYVSTAGCPSEAQRDLIRTAIKRMPAGSEIVSAMDADPAGREHSERIRKIFNSVRRAE
jgi:hypothetical protein